MLQVDNFSFAIAAQRLSKACVYTKQLYDLPKINLFSTDDVFQTFL